jgi:hypothetical protein
MPARVARPGGSAGRGPETTRECGGGCDARWCVVAALMLWRVRGDAGGGDGGGAAMLLVVGGRRCWWWWGGGDAGGGGGRPHQVGDRLGPQRVCRATRGVRRGRRYCGGIRRVRGACACAAAGHTGMRPPGTRRVCVGCTRAGTGPRGAHVSTEARTDAFTVWAYAGQPLGAGSVN